MRPQGREVEREGRKVVMTTAWRNKSYHRMKFSKPVIQVKENIFEGSAERSTL